MGDMIIAAFNDGEEYKRVSGLWQWDYGQILRIQGLNLPTAVEVDFAVAGASESVARIGTTKDGVTDVVIPDSLIEMGKNLVAYVYLRDSESGNTEYQIDMVMSKRAKPEAYDTPADKELFGQAIEAVNTAADRAEKAGQTAQEAATKTGQDAEQTAQDRIEVEKMVDSVASIDEQVTKVEQLSKQAQESVTQAGALATAAEQAKAQAETAKAGAETAAGKTAEDRAAVNQARTAVEEVQRAVKADRTAVEEVKQSVEQLGNAIPEATKAGVQAVNQAKQTAVYEIVQTGTAHKTAVDGAGTKAVQYVENVKQTATEAVETAKTEATQAVQTEGAKQIKAVQEKGTEVLQSIPEDFQTQMEAKLNKQQGIENKGKALVIGDDGLVIPGEVQSGGGDGIAIINTMSGESPLVIPDSAERTLERLELGGKTEQAQTTGANIFDQNLLLDFNSENYDKTQSSRGFYFYKFKVDGTVAVSTAKLNKNGEYLTVGIKPDGSDKTWLSHGSADISKYKTLTPEDGNIYLGVNNILERVENMLKNTGGIIINEGAAAKPYEPYTGGKPSPSPEYPQEIKNSGKWNEETRKYEVDVKVTGKNLFDVNYFTKNENYQNKDGDATHWKYATLKVEPNTTYTVSKSLASKVNGGINNDFNFAGALFFYNNTNSVKITSKDNGILYVMLYNRNEDANILKEMDIQVELGEKLTEYQPYQEQTLTITSDRPITKWDRLVEQDGQIGWLYKSKTATITGKEHYSAPSESYYSGTSTDIYTVDFGLFIKGGEYCNRLQRIDGIWDSSNINNIGFTTNGSNQIHIRIYNSLLNVSDNATKEEKVAAFKTYLTKEYENGNPYIVIFQTKDTEFVPLPQSEQSAIRALKTYYPTTVITADGGELDPDIKATYTADTKNYIDNKISAKMASIMSQYQNRTVKLLSLMPMETQAAMIENDTNNILESEVTQ